MLAKPTVPVSPVIVKETVVVVVSCGVIFTSAICCAVTFPLIARSTFAPPSVVADAVVV